MWPIPHLPALSAVSAQSDAWLEEVNECGIDAECYYAADCTDWPEVLDIYRIQALSDPRFDTSFVEWVDFVLHRQIWLALEQSCSDGVLLPMDSRVLRLRSCPREMQGALSHFFECCPVHVRHYLAHYFFLMVRMDRARRTGSPEWRPPK